MASSNLLLHLNGKRIAGLESDIHSAEEIAIYLYGQLQMVDWGTVLLAFYSAPSVNWKSFSLYLIHKI